MPLLEFDFPLTYEELRFAHKILAFAASTYIWSTGEKDAPKVSSANSGLKYEFCARSLRGCEYFLYKNENLNIFLLFPYTLVSPH